MCACVHVFVCVCTCAHMCVIYTCSYLYACGSQRTFRSLSMSTFFSWDRTSQWTWGRVGARKVQRSSCLCLPPNANTVVTGTLDFMSVGDQNSDPCFWTTSTLAHWAISSTSKLILTYYQWRAHNLSVWSMLFPFPEDSSLIYFWTGFHI